MCVVCRVFAIAFLLYSVSAESQESKTMLTFEAFRKSYSLKPIHDYTFLGTEHSAEKPIVTFNGKIEGWFDPAEHVVWVKKAMDAGRFELELVDGYLPALKYLYRDPDSAQTCEMTIFATDAEPEGALHIYVRLVETGVTRCLRLKDMAQVAPAEFEAQLQKLREHWEGFFKRGAQIESEPTVLNACKASIIRALITFVGRHPHYGVKYYWEKRHEGFPPTILALTNCLLDWGHVDMAIEYLCYYFEHFVSDEGKFKYYGPSLAEYGQMLTLVRRLHDVTPKRDWLARVRPKVEKIRQWLWADFEKAPNGLLSGVPEADTHKEIDVYFHNNAWCWRGLKEICPVLGVPDEDRCAMFRHAILKAIDEVTDRSCDPPFIPPVARKMMPFKSMVQDRFASYTNYRYWLELLSSGILSREQAEAIIKYRITHDGEVAGMTHFRHFADDWPIAEYASARLALGDVEGCRNILFSHLAGHMTPNTWTAYEAVSIEPDKYRRAVADYCVPSQLVAPRLAAWLYGKGRQAR